MSIVGRLAHPESIESSPGNWKDLLRDAKGLDGMKPRSLRQRSVWMLVLSVTSNNPTRVALVIFLTIAVRRQSRKLTKLTFNGLGAPPLSARGCRRTLSYGYRECRERPRFTWFRVPFPFYLIGLRICCRWSFSNTLQRFFCVPCQFDRGGARSPSIL